MRLSQWTGNWRGYAARTVGSWVWSVNRGTLRSDAQAGRLGALVVLPQGIAFAALAGLAPACGLYTCIVPCIVAALAGSSRLLVSGSTNAVSPALATMLAPLAAVDNPACPPLAMGVTVGVGLLQAALGLLRLGAITNFISPSVMLGFLTGAAVLIGIHAGIDLAKSWPEVVVGLTTLAVSMLARRCFGHGQHMLLALAAPILAHISVAAIAGLLLVVAWGLLDIAQWRRVLHLDRTEAAIAGGTLVATLAVSLEIAVLGGVAASLITYLYRSARPSLRTMGFSKPFDEDALRPFVIADGAPAGTLPECPQLKLLRTEGAVYFGAVAHVMVQPQYPRCASD